MRTDRSSFRPDCLAGKVAFITGGGSGICKGIARQLLLHGAEVIIASRDMKKLAAAAQELSAETGKSCYPVAMDVRDEATVVAAVEKALQQVSTIDILINGAAGNFLCAAADLKYKGFKAVMEIDAHGAFIVSKAIFSKCFKPEAHQHSSHLAKCSSVRECTAVLPPKVIINISATLHYTATLLQVHAGSAKAAVDALTRHLAVEWGPYNVRVNCIAPGPIRGTAGLARLSPFGKSNRPAGKKEQLSELVQHDAGQPPRDAPDKTGDNAVNAERFSQLIPMQRLGVIDDVAYSALFLCLPEASYITGACLVVDGGQWLTSGNFTLLEPNVNKQWRLAPCGGFGIIEQTCGLPHFPQSPCTSHKNEDE